MVSPVDGPGASPVSYLPVPTGGRAVVPYARGDGDGLAGQRGGSPENRRSAVSNAAIADAAVATPIGPDRPGARDVRTNPFLDRGDAFRRPLSGLRPDAAFLAQAIGQDLSSASGADPSGADPSGADLSGAAAEASRRYQLVQDTVDREIGRRRSPPAIDILT